MDDLNGVARRGGLSEYKTYSRIWEYPWLWFHLQSLANQNFRILDAGSERSPFPWFLATQGFDVIVSDISLEYWGLWKETSRKLRVAPRLQILDSQNLNLPTASMDIYESISIIEHVPNKVAAIEEAARVLKPGGLLLLTFDICEPDMGMTFPAWNGRALTMQELDQLFVDSPWFERGLEHIKWNVETIPEYLSWVRTTAPHHNYACGAVAIRRTLEGWTEPSGKKRITPKSYFFQNLAPETLWRIRSLKSHVGSLLPQAARSAIRKALSWRG
jgi:ubiquinone/menaquinone biosynthesis C-methylase UbiE